MSNAESDHRAAVAPPAKTEVGSYFIANYPPFSAWDEASLSALRETMRQPPGDAPLGLYLHIPFCRKRCKFCYFRVYTDKRADEIETYMDALSREIGLVRDLPCLGDRPVRFVYFGGGTPSFLSVRQLESLFARLQKNLQWDRAEEITFECEPGTLSEPKVRVLKELGVTRLSLGVENFGDKVLQENGRAHLSAEIFRSWDWIQQAGFPNVNVDLIAGMVGETWENWRDCVARTQQMNADSVTIYQMELPYNTVYSRELLSNNGESSIADWDTKRAWVNYAFDTLIQGGYHISSAYTLVRDPRRVNFSYRDNLWQGSDLLATGVASFGHISGMHYQNQPEWGEYVQAIQGNELPLFRAMRPTVRQLLIRELVLQLKRGVLNTDYFQKKFGVDIRDEWRGVWRELAEDGYMDPSDGHLRLNRGGLLCVDSLLPRFFEPRFQGARYT